MHQIELIQSHILPEWSTEQVSKSCYRAPSAAGCSEVVETCILCFVEIALRIETLPIVPALNLQWNL